MIYEYKKYKGIKEFYENKPVSNLSKKFTIVNKCLGCLVENGKIVMNDHCFGCLFCLANLDDFRCGIENSMELGFVYNAANEAFKAVPIKPKVQQKGLRHPYTSLEKFTAVDETTNIQPWAAGILSVLSTPKSRISLEVPVFNYDYDRNGRLDICAMVNGKLLIVESKTTLEDALSDERFIEQHVKYTEVINNITDNYLYLTLIGGRETDLYPSDSPFCTGTIGNMAQRFHKMLVDNKIQIITANALWCLCCKYLTAGEEYSWDNYLSNIFKDSKCIGLLSAGKLMYDNRKVYILPIY